MTGRRSSNEDVAESTQTMALSGVIAALKQAPLGIAIFDREMRYLAASAQFLTDQGLSGDTPLVGRVHYEVFPQIPARWRAIRSKRERAGRTVPSSRL